MNQDLSKYFSSLKNITCFDSTNPSHLPYHVMNRMIEYIKLCSNDENTFVQRNCTHIKSFVHDLLNIQEGDVFFGSSIQQLIMNLSHNIPIETYEEVIISSCLKDSYFKHFKNKSKYVKVWKSIKYAYHYNDLFDLITPKTSMLILPHISHITGYIFDIQYISEYAKLQNSNIKIIVDGSLYIQYHIVDVSYINVDYYFSSFIGTRIAFVYIKDLNKICDIEIDNFEYNLMGVLGVCDYIKDVTMEDILNRKSIESYYSIIENHRGELYMIFLKYMGKYDNLFEVIRDTSFFSKHIPIFSLKCKVYDVEYIHHILEEFGYKTKLIDEEKILQISFCHFNNEKDIIGLFHILNEFNKQFYVKLGLLSIFFSNSEDFTFNQYSIPQSLQDCLNNDVNKKENITLLRYSLIDKDPYTLITNIQYKSSINSASHINILHDPKFQIILNDLSNTIIKMFKIECKYFHIHQLRIYISNNSITPVPEFIYNTISSFVAILCVNESNTVGGIHQLFTRDNVDLNNQILHKGDIFVFNNKDFTHYITNISQKIDNDCAFKDLIFFSSIF
jgi:selenocysteine lyase/cysteine desulfurase